MSTCANWYTCRRLRAHQDHEPKGLIPDFKVGGQRRFKRTDMGWIEEQRADADGKNEGPDVR